MVSHSAPGNPAYTANGRGCAYRLKLHTYRRIGHAGSFTCRTVAQKLETQNKKEDQISTPHPPDNAESEVFSEVRVPGVRFF